MTRRYPLEPLATAAGITLQTRGGGNQPGQPQGLSLLALQLGISHRRARRARSEGITETQADTWAIRLGLHPTNVWPDWGQHQAS